MKPAPRALRLGEKALQFGEQLVGRRPGAALLENNLALVVEK